LSSFSKFWQILRLIAIYALAIAIVNTIHFQFFPVRVVLYDASLDVVIAGILVLILYGAWPALARHLSPEETGLSFSVGLLMGLFYAISVPTVIDRSLSMYILEKIDQRGGGIRRDAIEGVFKEEYTREHRLVDIRLTEQINSGTIIIKNGCVVLTDRGRRIVAFTRFYRTRMLPKRRDIMGQLTDDLTNPFRNSTTNTNYGCDPGKP
jgi:small basic protein